MPRCSPRRRPSSRRRLLALCAAFVLAPACSKGAKQGCFLCAAATVVVGEAVGEVAADDIRRLEACGVCPAGERCNPLDEPPRCRPHPGNLGTPCRRHSLDELSCEKGTYCNSALVPAVCSRPEPEGSACFATDACEPHLYCHDWSDEGGTCRPKLPEGSECGAAGDYACAEGLVCRLGESPKRCRKRGPVGDPCERDRDCAAGLQCDCRRAPCVCGP